jgi:conjugative relaxase-like TrwC/TraI family protein
MLSLANVSPKQGATYYKTENYYSKSDAVGYSRWEGEGAERNALQGAVDHHAFTRLLAGKHPDIEVGGKKDNRRAGLDMTFSAPKSVSIQALVFGDSRLVEAHRQSVQEALKFAERHFAIYRDGPKEARRKEQGTGLIVAQFEHDTSRLKDPQLHTHNVVLNRIETKEGKIKALCADEIYKNSVLLGMVYQNSLAQKAKEIGYEIKAGPKGTFELEGFSKEQLSAFSKRKEQMDGFDEASYREKRQLVLKDRKAKTGPQLRADLEEGWKEEAKKAGILELKPKIKTQSEAQKESKNEPSRNDPLADEKREQIENLLTDSITHATLRSAVFKKEDALKAALEMGLGRFSTKDLQKAFEEQLGVSVLETKEEGYFTSKEAVERDLETREITQERIGKFSSLANEEKIRKRVDSLSELEFEPGLKALGDFTIRIREVLRESTAFDEKIKVLQDALLEGKRLSLAEITGIRSVVFENVSGEIKAEATKEAGAKERKEKEKEAIKVSKTEVRSAFADLEKTFLAPTKGQLQAIEATLSSRDGVVLWQGVAGAGKTFSMRQIVEEARASGVEVMGFAPSAAAALQLQKDAGISTQTLQSHLVSRENYKDKTSQEWAEGKKESNQKLWIVDEAGMVSAAEMNALLSKAKNSDARVLLVGDTAQLSSVDAGNPFLDLQKNTQTTVAVLGESLRQKDVLLQRAVTEMYQGEMSQALSLLENSVMQKRTREARVEEAAKRFLEASKPERQGILLLAKTNETRSLLTERIREGLKKEGTLKNPKMVDVFEKIDLPKSKQKYASSYVEGSLLVPNRSYKSLGLEKNASYEITNVDTRRNRISVLSPQGKREIDLKNTSQFSLYLKSSIEVAEGDRMIWNRNIKPKGQLNNREFVVEKITKEGVVVKTDAGERKVLAEREHMEHAWALTVHKSQGRTTQEVVLVGDKITDKKSTLVSITRATDKALLLTPHKETFIRQASKEVENPIAAEVVKTCPEKGQEPEPQKDLEKAVVRKRSRGRSL